MPCAGETSITARVASKGEDDALRAAPGFGGLVVGDEMTSPERIQSLERVLSDLSGRLGAALSVSRFAGSDDRLAA